MRSRFIFLLATWLVIGCRDGTLPGTRTAEARREQGARVTLSEVTTRRVWSGPDVDALGGPTPDGRFLTFIDWSTGALALRELATGNTRPLVKTAGDLTEFAYLSVVSDDGKQIAYSFYDSDDVYDLRVIGVDGSNPRTVFRNADALDVMPMDWSSDGAAILATIRWKDRTSQIALISSSTGERRVLKTLGWQYPSRLALSSDGGYVLYDFAPDDETTARDVAILAVDGSLETIIARHAANDQSLGWTRDGRVLFASDRDGTIGVWAVATAKGRATGAPVRLKSDLWRFDKSLGVDHSDALYYSINPTVADLHVVTIDAAGAKVLSPATSIGGAQGITRGPGDWSPDGRLLAFLASEPGQGVSVSFSAIVVRALESGQERTLSPQLARLNSIQWFPDGQSLLVGATDMKGRLGQFRVDAQSGGVVPLRLHGADEQNVFGSNLSPDGGTMYFRSFADSKGQVAVLKARDLRSGEEREVYRRGGTMGWGSPSPDGRQLALPVVDADRRTSIVVVPAEGGTARTVFTLPEGRSMTPNRGLIVWGPENTLIFMVGKTPKSQRESEVWRVRLDGSGGQTLDIGLSSMMRPRLHPDGRRLLFRAGEVTKEIWVMQQ